MVSAAIRILTLVEQTSYMGDGKSPFRGYGAIRAGSWLALKGLGPATATAKVGRAALVSNFDAEAMRGGSAGSTSQVIHDWQGILALARSPSGWADRGT